MELTHIKPTSEGAAARSSWRQDALPLFLMTAFPIHLWSYFNFMREFPAWLARLSTADLIATIGFSQMMPLIESAIVFVLLLIVAVFLSRWLETDRRLAVLFSALLISSAWAVVFHVIVDSIRHWRLEFLALGLVYLATLGLPIWLIVRSKRVAAGVNDALERLNVLSAVYIAVDMLCLLVVIGFLLL